jgi:hypothetical protein
MKKVIRLTESDLIKIIKTKLNEEETEIIEMPASEYLQLLSVTGYNGAALEKTRKFRGKKIKVIGDLNLNAMPITNLGTIHITGSLRASNSGLSTLEGVTIDVGTLVYGTPYQKKLDRIRRQKEIDDAQERRENDEWNLNNTDEEGEKANAVFIYALRRGDLTGISDDDRERADDTQREIKRLENEQENLDTEDDDWNEKYDEITNKIDELQDEWDEIMSGKVDLYDLKPIYGNYSMSGFDSIEEGYEYNVGTIREADVSLEDYVESLLDDIGYQGFSRHLIERHIDGDEVADSFENSIRDDIYENPEGWDIRRELSRDQYEEIWLLEMEKWVYENEGVRYPIKYPTKEDNGTVFDFMDEGEEHQFQLRYEGNKWTLYKDGSVAQPGQLYRDDEETQEHEDDRESRISDIEYEIDEIKENPDGDLDEDSIEESVEDRKYDISQDPMRWLNDYGIDDYSPFINRREFLKDLVDDMDYGRLGSYDDDYDEVEVNGTTYIVVRIN